VRKAVMTIAQNAWRKIGVKCNTQVFEWAVFLQDFVNKNNFDALVLGWNMDAGADLYQLWHSSQSQPNQLNFVGYSNPEADRLIVMSLITPRISKRRLTVLNCAKASQAIATGTPA
jgi:ABC-type transport system substrate-binding protein